MRVSVLLLPLVLGAFPLMSQQTRELEPGTRIRVTVAGGESRVHIGLYQMVHDTALVLQAAPAPLSIPLGLVRSLELSRGRKPSVVGGGVGLLVGGAIGAVALGFFGNTDDYGVPGGGQDDTKFLLGGVVGGVIGGAVGAFLFRRERWEPLEFPVVWGPRP